MEYDLRHDPCVCVDATSRHPCLLLLLLLHNYHALCVRSGPHAMALCVHTLRAAAITIALHSTPVAVAAVLECA